MNILGNELKDFRGNGFSGLADLRRPAGRSGFTLVRETLRLKRAAVQLLNFCLRSSFTTRRVTRESVSNPRSLNGCVWFVIFLSTSCSALWAQTLPDAGQELRRQDRQRQELRQQSETLPWTPSSKAQQTPEHQKIPQEWPCFRIDTVRVQGTLASSLLVKALRGAGADDAPEERCLGSQGITILIQRVQQSLLEQGYITSHVKAPQQDLNSGILILQVDEGRVAALRSSDMAMSLPKMAWTFESGDILNLRDIEQSVDNLRRLPSLQPSVQVQPGTEPGTSDVVISIQVQKPLRLGLTLDDGGSKATGKLQGNATLSWDSPLGLTDMAYITQGQDMGLREAGPRGAANRIFHYSVPWGYWLLGATWSDNRYHQTVYGPFESYLYSGISSQREISLQRVVHRDGLSKTVASIKGFLRQSNNFISDLEVIVQRRRTSGWEGAVQHTQYFEQGSLSAQLAYRRGTGAFGAEPAPEEIAGQGTGRMQLMTGSVQWSMPLKWADLAWQYTSLFQWQWNRTRLTAQDRFCIGGRSTVRGFDGVQTLCGDRGQLWRQELAIPWADQYNVHAYSALDVGRAHTSEQDGTYQLSGVALGLRGQFTLNEKYPVLLDAWIARPFTRPEGFATASLTSGFSLRTEF